MTDKNKNTPEKTSIKADSVKVDRKFEERTPILERKITKSKDGQWLIFRTIRTDIVHVNYLDAILSKGE